MATDMTDECYQRFKKAFLETARPMTSQLRNGSKEYMRQCLFCYRFEWRSGKHKLTCGSRKCEQANDAWTWWLENYKFPPELEDLRRKYPFSFHHYDLAEKVGAPLWVRFLGVFGK
jgi:hypothetical protein